MNKIDYADLKKNDEITSIQLGRPIPGKLLESPKQGKGLKNVILIWTKGSVIGMFDETGSVEARQVTNVKRDNKWLEVINHPTHTYLKKL